MHVVCAAIAACGDVDKAGLVLASPDETTRFHGALWDDRRRGCGSDDGTPFDREAALADAGRGYPFALADKAPVDVEVRKDEREGDDVMVAVAVIVDVSGRLDMLVETGSGVGDDVEDTRRSVEPGLLGSTVCVASLTEGVDRPT